GVSLGLALHRLQAAGRAPVKTGVGSTEPSRNEAAGFAGAEAGPRPMRRPDVRVGSATDGLAPVSFAERSLAASPAQWLALAAIAFAAIAADQLTKYVVSSQLQLDDGLHVLGPFWIHHVRNSGIA